MSHSLAKAGITIGDVGVIVNMKTGTGTAFMYCDAAGEKSVGVSEFSEKVSDELGGDHDPVCVFSFPGSADSPGAAQPDKTNALIAQCFEKAPATFILGQVVARLAAHPAQQVNVQTLLRVLGLHPLNSFRRPFR